MEPSLVALIVVVVVVVLAQGLKFVHDAVQAMAAEHEAQAKKARAAHQARIRALLGDEEGHPAERRPARVTVERRPDERPRSAPGALADRADAASAEGGGLADRRLRDSLSDRPRRGGLRDHHLVTSFAPEPEEVPAAERGLWARLERLSPLQRGVVLHEVFGPPRARRRAGRRG